MSLKKHEVVVVGNGMVNVRFCERLLEYDKNKRFHIKVLGEENRPAYDRVQLTSFYEKESADELLIETAARYGETGIELRLGKRNDDIKGRRFHLGPLYQPNACEFLPQRNCVISQPLIPH